MTEDRGRVMVKVCLSRSIAPRRDWTPFLKQNPKAWKALRVGETIDFPVDELLNMRGSIEVTSAQSPMETNRKKPVRIVKDNLGNIWHDGVLVSGPSFNEQEELKRRPQPEASSSLRMTQQQYVHQARKASEESGQPAEEKPAEEKPSSEEVTSANTKPKPKRRRKKS